MEEMRRTGLGDKARLLAALTVLLLAGFLGTGYFAFLAARDSIRANIEKNDLPVAAESVYARLQKDLVEPVFVSSMMANDTFLHDWIVGGERDRDAVVRYLGEIKARYGAFTAFFVSERTGRYYYPEGVLKIVSPSEPRDEWYYRVRSMSEPYELNVDPDLANADALTIFINYRVIDTDGTYLGAAGVGLAVDSMTRMVATLKSEYGTNVYFVDKAGRIVAGEPYGGPGTEDPALAPIYRRDLRVGPGSFRYRRGSENVLLFVRWLPEVGWFLFVERPEDAAMAGARRALYLNLVVYVLILVLALLAAGFTVNRFQSRLERTASFDPLTGAMNRLAFQTVAEHSIREARREGRPLSVILFDIDHFKAVNDTLGHAAGDEALKTVVRTCAATLRASDLLCRWGGEEFLVLLPASGPDGAFAAAEKLRAAVSAEKLAPGSPTVTISAGTATLRPEEDLSSLVQRADERLLEAKRAGRDRTVRAG